MADYPAILLADPIQAPSGSLTPALDGYAIFTWPGQVSVTAAPTAGVTMHNGPIGAIPTVRSAVKQTHFFDDFYNRIHLRPNVLALGNLIADVTRVIEVWNAHLVDQDLSSVTPVNDDGMNLAEPTPAPTTFTPLESRLYTLIVNRAGRGIIDASYTFDFGTEMPQLVITGKRVLTWSLSVNWREPVQERLTFLTDVMTARNGKEQRRALRALPRRAFDVLHTVRESERQQVDAWLSGWQHRLWVMPVPTDSGSLAAAASAGDLVLSVDTAEQDFSPGGLAVLIAPDGRDEAAEIESVTAVSVTLTKPLLRSWPAGTRCQPGRLARLQAVQPVSQPGSRLAELRVQFDLEPHTLATPAVDSATLYRGHPVLLDRPNWREPINRDYQHDLAIIDNQTGVRGVHDRRGTVRVQQDWLWTRFGRAKINALRGWLLARKGRLNAFWAETQTDDLTVADITPAGNAYLVVGQINYLDLLAGQPARQDIAVRLRDGSRYYRRVLTAGVPSGGLETLTLDASIPVDVTPDNVARVSWLMPCRLEGDEALITWPSTAVAESRSRIRSLADEL